MSLSSLSFTYYNKLYDVLMHNSMQEIVSFYADSSSNLNSLVTFPRLQSDSDCRVNFKYHEEIGVFCKNGRPGLEPAISLVGNQAL